MESRHPTQTILALAISVLGALVPWKSHSAEPPRAFASALGHCSPPPETADLQTIARWAEQIQLIPQKAIQETSHPRDHRLALGAVIAGECIESLGKKAPQYIQALEEAFARTFTQSYRCEKTLGLTAVADALFVLKNTTIHCDPGPSDYDASNRIVDWHFWEAPFTAVGAGADHHYLFNVPPSSAFYRNEILAEILLHEALHSTASNNRDATHSDVRPENVQECDSTPFLDRVYFQAAACFPTGAWGDSLPSVMRKCPKLCVRAMTEVEPSAGIKKAVGTGSIFGLSGVVGPDLNAHPLSLSEAQILCQRILDSFDIRQAFVREERTIQDQINLDASKLKQSKILPPELRKTLSEFSEEVVSFHQPQATVLDRTEKLRQLNTEKQRIQSHIDTVCTQPAVPTAWINLCAVQGSVVTHALDAWISVAQKTLQKLQSPAGPQQARLEEILEFYKGAK